MNRGKRSPGKSKWKIKKNIPLSKQREFSEANSDQNVPLTKQEDFCVSDKVKRHLTELVRRAFFSKVQTIKDSKRFR